MDISLHDIRLKKEEEAKLVCTSQTNFNRYHREKLNAGLENAAATALSEFEGYRESYDLDGNGDDHDVGSQNSLIDVGNKMEHASSAQQNPQFQRLRTPEWKADRSKFVYKMSSKDRAKPYERSHAEHIKMTLRKNHGSWYVANLHVPVNSQQVEPHLAKPGKVKFKH